MNTHPIFAHEYNPIAAETIHPLLEKIASGKIGFMRKFAGRKLLKLLTELSLPKFGDTHTSEITAGGCIALSPYQASICVVDHERTYAFTRGVIKAIQEQRAAKECDSPIRVLYAGTGPFATLALPAMNRFSPRDVQFTLLDIQPASIVNAAHIVRALGFGDFIEDTVCDDAITYSPPGPFDIIISETMVDGLAHEPLVLIYNNLKRFLKRGGDFIPQDVHLGFKVERDDNQFNYTSPTPLYRLSDEHEDPSTIRLTERMTRELPDCRSTHLTTRVVVHRDITIEHNDSAITRDILMGKCPSRLVPGDVIETEYGITEFPCFTGPSISRSGNNRRILYTHTDHPGCDADLY